jgi:hypothetical protein
MVCSLSRHTPAVNILEVDGHHHRDDQVAAQRIFVSLKMTQRG